MIVSLLHKVLSVPLVLLRSEATKDAKLLVLRHENTVRRQQLTIRGGDIDGSKASWPGSDIESPPQPAGRS